MKAKIRDVIIGLILSAPIITASAELTQAERIAALEAQLKAMSSELQQMKERQQHIFCMTERNIMLS